MTDRNQYETRFGVRVPVEEPAARTNLDIRPRRIQEWVRQLPLADAPASARRLHRLLQTVNRMPLRAAARYKFAEALDETVGFVTRTLLAGISQRGFPLTGKSLDQADLSTALLGAFADTYKLVASDALQGGRGERKLLGASVQQAMQQLGRLLLNHYTLYAPASDGLWLDLHRLYRIAEDNDLVTPPTTSRRAPPGARIGELYRQTLLITLANPYRLRRDELGRVVTLTASLAHKLILSPRPTSRTSFQVRTEQDRPPYSRAHEHDSVGVRYIDLSAVVTALQQNQSRHNPPEVALQQRLLAFWHRPPRRGYSRVTQSGDVRVGLGLKTAHFLLEREAPPTPESPAIPAAALGAVSPIPVPTRSEAEMSLDDRWDAQGRFYPTGMAQYWTQPYPLPGAALPEPEYRDFLWRTIDVSARGCCLLWDRDTPSQAKVGELISLREQETASWIIGVVRWMQNQRNVGLKLGIEILAPAAAAVLTRTEQRDSIGDRHHTAIELASVSAAGQPASLVLSSTEHRVGEQLEVLQHGKPKRVRLTEELERNGHFSRFMYEWLDRRDTGAGSSPSPVPAV